jgi:hypothetical protein
MAIPHEGMGTPLHNRSFWCLFAVIVIAHALGQRNLGRTVMDQFPAPVRGFAYASVLTVALLLAPEADKAFVYFQF